MNEYVILRSNSKGVFFNYVDDPNIFSVFKAKNKFIIKLFMKFCICGRSLLYDDWKKRIKKCHTIILFDNGMYPDIIRYIRRKNKNCKIIFYYWNFINDYNKSYLYDKNIDEIWSFDLKDCEKYNLRYNPQLYSKNVPVNNKDEKTQIIFLGRDKGRKKQILDLQSECHQMNISTDFHIIENEKYLINYEDYLKMLKDSNTILDIIDNSHTGMTLRCMESLFLEKKLITNNLDIINYDFYDKNNIFVIGKDDLSNLKDFLTTPYKKVKEKIVNYYDYESWLNRFLGR